jgi:transposase
MKHKDARSLSTEAKEAIRLRAVKAVQDGMNQVEAAKHFGVARGTISRWLKQLRQQGEKALKAKPQGRPRGTSRLKGWQAATVVRMVTDQTPDQLKLPFMLWTREAVADLIAEKFGIHISLMTAGRWLKRWGFTPQKPVRKAWEQNPKEVSKWLNEDYPAIRRQAKQEGAEIHWGDEMGMRSDHQTGRSYSKKGETPEIPGSGKRFSCNMISTVTNRGTLRFMVFDGRFTSELFVTFLKRLVKCTSQKVYLIVDGHPVHKSQKVKEWLKNKEDQIQMFFLPAYSPELNPDEFLNQDVKSNAVGRRRAENKKELIEDVRGYLRSTQKQSRLVKSFFHAKTVRYAKD